ncbi:MAG: hypothetical protein QOH96_1840 [Blastocatellia bacterium]|jgi:hypothetical protein|nr:hypothetical protein [Blastocatellia bacterium]
MLISITRTRAIFISVLAVFLAGCIGASRPPDAGGPRANEQTYPVVYQASPERIDAVKAVWINLSRSEGISDAPLPDLEPVTATIRDLPSSGNVTLHLPKVGTAASMSAEDTRESLKRFVDQTRVLIGAEPVQLSLVQNEPAGNAAQIAVFEQTPFRYPIRNGFGVVRIGFVNDRRVSKFSSTCIPNLGVFQRILAGVKTTVTADQAGQLIPGKSFTYTDKTGQHQFTVAVGTPVTVKPMVLFPIRSNGDASIALHLAWEVKVVNGGERTVYIDAVDSQILAAE